MTEPRWYLVTGDRSYLNPIHSRPRHAQVETVPLRCGVHTVGSADGIFLATQHRPYLILFPNGPCNGVRCNTGQHLRCSPRRRFLCGNVSYKIFLVPLAPEVTAQTIRVHHNPCNSVLYQLPKWLAGPKDICAFHRVSRSDYRLMRPIYTQVAILWWASPSPCQMMMELSGILKDLGLTSPLIDHCYCVPLCRHFIWVFVGNPVGRLVLSCRSLTILSPN